jgi:hypothetical protein
MCDGKKAAAAGKAKPDKPCDGSKTTCPSKKRDPKKIRYITFTSIRFLSDHGIMKNNLLDYRNTGDLYPRTHWTPDQAYPISHTSDKKIEIDLEYEVGPAGAVAESGDLICTDMDGDEWFRKAGVKFSAGKAKLRLESAGFIKHIDARRYLLNWSIEKMTVAPSPSATRHEIVFTVDTPVGFTGDYDPGVTSRRLVTSAHLVKPMDSVDSHTVVKGLMTRLKFYVLQPDKAVPEKFGHPTYFLKQNGKLLHNNEGGAWPMMDFLDYYGECQAIVRFVGNVVKQLGMPGTAEKVFIFAIPADPLVAKESTTGGLGSFPGYTLADKKVQLGQVYPPSHSRMPDGSSSPGFNNYEACLKFSDGGVTKYYGGGMQGASLDTAQEVLKGFYALVKVRSEWYPNDTDPKKVRGLKIVEILARRKDW